MEELYRANNFPREQIFYNILKQSGIQKSHSQVKEFIAKQGIFQVHKQVAETKAKEQHFTAHEPNHIWQCDLIDYNKYAKQNHGNHWILIVIDVFTREGFARPVKKKEAKLVAEAFSSIVQEEQAPRILFHDSGTEFLGPFKTFCDSNDIVDLQNEAGNHAALGIVDRFTRTLKTMIARHMTGNATTNWDDALESITKIYNNTPHGGVENLIPSEIPNDIDLRAQIGTLNFNKEQENLKRVKVVLNVGDHVRVMETKGTFKKGYEVKFSTKIYRIHSLIGNKAVLDDSSIHPKKKLMVVSAETTPIRENKEKTKAENEAKSIRKAASLGVTKDDTKNILTTKRERVLKDPHIRE